MNRPGRILHLLWDGHTGGTQRYVDGVVRGSLDRWDQMVCLFADPGDQINPQCPYPVRSLGLPSGFAWREARALAPIVEAFDPDVIHLHCDTPAFLHQAGRFAGRRLVYTEHGDSVVRARRQWLVRACWKWAARHLDEVLLNSKFARDVFVKQQPRLAPRCTVLPNPLLGEIPARLERANGRFRIGGIGRLHPVKGFDRLVDAAAELAGRHDFELHLFGDGPERDALQQQAKRQVDGHPVIFHGLTRQPLEAIAGLDLLVVPSRQEAFGLTALEAQAVGTPVIATATGGLLERIEHNRTGLLCEPGDLPATIEQLLGNPDLRARLAEAAREEVRQTYSLNVHLDRLAQMYKLDGSSQVAETPRIDGEKPIQAAHTIDKSAS